MVFGVVESSLTVECGEEAFSREVIFFLGREFILEAMRFGGAGDAEVVVGGSLCLG